MKEKKFQRVKRKLAKVLLGQDRRTIRLQSERRKGTPKGGKSKKTFQTLSKFFKRNTSFHVFSGWSKYRRCQEKKGRNPQERITRRWERKGKPWNKSRGTSFYKGKTQGHFKTENRRIEISLTEAGKQQPTPRGPKVPEEAATLPWPKRKDKKRTGKAITKSRALNKETCSWRPQTRNQIPKKAIKA